MGQTLIPIEQTGMRRNGKHAGGVRQKYLLDEPGRRLILAKYDGRKETIEELAEMLCVPRWKVRRWASDLGLARSRDPRWTQDEIAYLERYLHLQSLDTIAKKLRRTKTAVRLKAKRLGINKCYQEGYTLRGLCLGLGCDHHKIRKWIEKGWLKGRRRGTEREANDCWYFSDAAIRDLVRHHPEEIDPRRADWLWLVDILLGEKGLGELASIRGERP